MPIIFKAKTQDGYVIKILAELLQNNLKSACFEIDKNGISLGQMDNNRTILILLSLNANRFNVYSYRRNEKMYMGVNLMHFHKMLKTIKKKDSVQFFIDDKNPNELGIKVIPNENNRHMTSYIKIQSDQNINISDVPTDYTKPIIVSSSEYQKTIKGLSSIGSMIDVKSRRLQIQFTCDADGVMSRTAGFGEPDDSDDESDEEEKEYNASFDTDQLVRVTKLSGLSPTIQIYPMTDMPLLFRSDIGQIGSISIYIKDRAQIAKRENLDMDDDDY